jgi:hypothetical protein
VSESKQEVRLTLTPEQQALVKQATDKDAGSLELTVQELEDRIAPAKITGGGKIGANRAYW